MSALKPPTIRDVAQTAGLSVATVSRYLNKQLRLPPETALNSPLTKSLRAESLDPSEHR
jgi:hypothetical protein